MTGKHNLRWKLQAYRNNPKQIIEFFNGMKVEEEFFDDVELEGSEQLEMFLNVIWPRVKKYKYSMHEQFKTFVCKNASATVKLDYLCGDGNRMVFIYDWKTGKKRDDYGSSLQVGTYVLWVVKERYKKPEDVVANLVYLKTGIVTGKHHPIPIAT